MPKLIPFVQCLHHDFPTKRIYGKKNPNIDYCINNRMNPFKAASEAGQNVPKAAVYFPIRTLQQPSLTATTRLAKPKCVGVAVPEYPEGLGWVDGWTHMVRTAVNHENRADYLVIIEDDMLIPRNAVAQLLHNIRESDFKFICGSYVRKDMTGESAHVAVSTTEKEQKRVASPEGCDVVMHEEVPMEIPFPDPFEERGLVENNHVVGFGCCVIDLRVFADMPFPWFYDVLGATPQNPIVVSYHGRQLAITQSMSHDAFFTRRLVLAGHRCAVDTDLQCLHVDRETGRVYGPPKYVSKDYELRLREADRFAIDQNTLQHVRHCQI